MIPTWEHQWAIDLMGNGTFFFIRCDEYCAFALMDRRTVGSTSESSWHPLYVTARSPFNLVLWIVIIQLRNLDRSFVPKCRNIIQIRNPMAMLPSWNHNLTPTIKEVRAARTVNS